VSRRRVVALWMPVLLQMALIFVLSSLIQPPELPGAGIEHLDKYVHVALYAGLSALFIRARSGGWSRPVTLGAALSAVIFSIAYGVTDEIHQYFVPTRQMDALDLVADSIGAALAAGVLYAGIIRARHGV
jgi:VanZ family protein